MKHTALEKQRGSGPSSPALLENRKFEELGKWMANLQIKSRLITAQDHEINIKEIQPSSMIPKAIGWQINNYDSGVKCQAYSIVRGRSSEVSLSNDER